MFLHLTHVYFLEFCSRDLKLFMTVILFHIAVQAVKFSRARYKTRKGISYYKMRKAGFKRCFCYFDMPFFQVLSGIFLRYLFNSTIILDKFLTYYLNTKSSSAWPFPNFIQSASSQNRIRRIPVFYMKRMLI